MDTAEARKAARNWSVNHKGRGPGRSAVAWVNDLADALDATRSEIETAERARLAAVEDAERADADNARLVAETDATAAKLAAQAREAMARAEAAEADLAAIRAHCYGPGNESAMDQMLARTKAAEAENAALRNELARYQGMTMHADHPAVIAAERDRLRASLENMVRQFAFWAESTGGYWTGGLSALEEAFEVLDWNDPSENPEARCDEPGCMKRWTCGTQTPGGYRTTCFEHQPKVADEPPTA